MNNNLYVYVVGYFDSEVSDKDPFFQTVFADKEPAEKMVECLRKNNKKWITMDRCPVYHHFFVQE